MHNTIVYIQNTSYSIFIPCPPFGVFCKFWRLLCSGQLLLFLVISHKRWPLLHYLGFKRQLGEFLGQLPRLKASMNYCHPCGPKLLWATKWQRKDTRMTFLKAEQQQKFGKLRLLAAEPAAGGGCLFNFCSFVTRELNFCELRIIAVTSLGPQKLVTLVLIPSPSQRQNPCHWSGPSLSASLSRFRLQMAGWHPAPPPQNTLWQQRSQALLPNWIQSSIQIFTWQEWSFNRLD